ncbi:MAG: proline dehydrogenase family protein [Myxococcaceae bacterium]|nr:proline dehydrogenase family protein [Myxococcaceae bacterium]MBH2006784.1 proline dehydrogenase family protein [Myxococcaceae bacterium]
MQKQIEELGLKLFEEMRGEIPGIFNSDYWQGKLMDWVMKDPSFRVDLFHFVDVLPQLRSSEQVAQHIKEYLLKEGRILPGVISVALKAATARLSSGIATRSIRKNISAMAERFVVGREVKSAIQELHALHEQGIAFTVDLLGEYSLSNQQADEYQKRYLDLIHHLVRIANQWRSDPVMDVMPRVHMSIKIPVLEPQIKAVDPVGSLEKLRKRILPLFEAADRENVFLNLDLGQWEYHEITYHLFESLSKFKNIGIVVQAYLKSSEGDLERLLTLAKKRGAPIGACLVKGAYWDFEVVNAQQKGFECPVFKDKAETDRNYEKLSRFLLDHAEHFHIAFGSHNLRSIAQAIVYAERQKIPSSAYEIQMLYGMAEPERKVLRARGHRVRVYAPIGELLPGMAYLVRCLFENTSNTGFLKLSHRDNIDPIVLLKEPAVSLEGTPKATLNDSANGSLTDFTKPENREGFQKSLDRWAKTFPIRVPVILSGFSQKGERVFEGVTPNDGQTVVARVEMASQEQAEQAIQNAFEAMTNWRAQSLATRTQWLRKLADILERDRFELAALQCYEVAKPWLEADRDVAEAIDSCRYYARQAEQELSPRKQGHLLGEQNWLSYEGRGPCFVLAPGNFSLAILCGMAVAALVSGNTVIMKPAKNASLVAKSLFDRILESGFPKEVCQFLPGCGSEIEAYWVEHPLVAQIAFSGSRDVGLQIIEKAAKTKRGQPQVKRVICEMGTKNAVIVDDDADLDEAVLGILHSAFGFAGQKSSAASRILVHEAIYESFVSRLIEGCQSLVVGSAVQPSISLPPVVDEQARQRLLHEIELASKENKLLYRGEIPDQGFFVPVALFEVESEQVRLMQQEFLGPILAIMKMKTFAECLRVAASTEFARTGMVYSRSPKNLELAKKEFRAGNLYFNRASTGLGMSGIGTKAGGPGYLLNFVDLKVVTENTL